MQDLDLVKRNKESDPKSWQTFREKCIEPKIREGKSKNDLGYSSNQEFAALRKALMYVFECLRELHPETTKAKEYEKFMTYCTTVEEIVDEFDEEFSNSNNQEKG